MENNKGKYTGAIILTALGVWALALIAFFVAIGKSDKWPENQKAETAEVEEEKEHDALWEWTVQQIMKHEYGEEE